MISEALLSISNLDIDLCHGKGYLDVIRDISLKIYKGETLCLVGESGCGKSVTALSILRLLPSPPFSIQKGEINFKGTDLLSLSPSHLQHIRGKEISMIFQEPMTALNPVLTIGFQIKEAISAHLKTSKKEADEMVMDLLKSVGMPSPVSIKESYPHQLSGGLRQRAMIAIALSCSPSLLIADEPTTALDVTIQAQILDLLERLRDKRGLSLFLITHNLGIVARVAHRVIIMYAGKIVEEGKVEAIFENPLHPYTQALLEAVPYGLKKGTKRLKTIGGNVPSIEAIPEGCAFHERCPRVMEICREIIPDFKKISEAGMVACHLY